MRPPFTTANQDDHAAAAACLMKHAGASALMVLHAHPGQPVGITTGKDIADAVADRFESAQFPFYGDRLIPRIAVEGTAGEISLETGLRRSQPWPPEGKRELIARGYALLDEVLADRSAA